MAKFFVIHNHKEEECEQVGKAWDAYNNPFKGNAGPLVCTCPSNEHGGYLVVEADSADAAKESWPSELRGTLKVLEMEEMPLG